MSTADALIESGDTSARTRASQYREKHGRCAPWANPWTVYPEREAFTAFEVWERPDGSRFRREREIQTWTTQSTTGEWSKWDLDDEGQRTRAAVVAGQGAAARLSTADHAMFMVCRDWVASCPVGRATDYSHVGLLWAALTADSKTLIQEQTGRSIDISGCYIAVSVADPEADAKYDHWRASLVA